MSKVGANEKYLILTERFFPEEFLVNDLAMELKKSSMDIEALTQVPSYPHDRIFDNYSNKLYQCTREYCDIKVHRVKTYCGYNRSLFRKIWNYLSFAFLTSLWCLFNGYKYKRVFIYQTGPLTMACGALIMRFFWRRKCVIWTQDLWPDSVYAYGFKKDLKNRLFLDSFIKLIYSACDRITVSSPGYAAKLSPYTSKEVEFLPQWNQIKFDSDTCAQVEKRAQKVFTFAGNLGTAQNLDVLVEAFGELKLSGCVLQLVGGGIMLEPLQELVKLRGYDNVVFTGRLPQEKMPEVFAASDVMIIALKEEYSLAVPAKFQAYIAGGKPICGIISGDTAELIKTYNIGVTATQSKEAIQEVFTRLAQCSESEIAQWGRNALALSEEKFDRNKLIKRISSMLTEEEVPARKSCWGTCLAIVGILLLGAGLIALQRIMEPEMERDSSLYLVLAEKWSRGGLPAVLEYWPGFWIPPLYLYTVAILSRWGLTVETAALAINIFLAILMPLVTLAIAREITGNKKLALAAALLTAVHPAIVEMAVQAQRDILYLFVGGWCIYMLIAGIRRNKWYWWGGAGVCFAMALLIRFETFEFLALLGMYFIIVLFKDRARWKVVLRNLIVFVCVFMMVFLLLLHVTGTSELILSGYAERIVYHLTSLFNGGA